MKTKPGINKYEKVPGSTGAHHTHIKKKNVSAFIKLFDELITIHGSQNAVELKYHLNKGLYATMRDKGVLTTLMAKRILNAHKEAQHGQETV